MIRPVRTFTALALLGALSTSAHAAPGFGRHAYYDAAPAPLYTGPSSPLQGFVAQRDAQRGTPTFVWGGAFPSHVLPSASAEDAARAHLSAYASLWGLGPDALASVQASEVHDIGRGGILVAFSQSVSGLPVFHEKLSVLLRRDLTLVALGGSLRSDAVATRKSRAFARSPEQALASALNDLYGTSLGPRAFLPSPSPEAEGGYALWNLANPSSGAASGLRFQAPARLRKVLFPLPDRLVPAYHLEVYVQTRAGAAADMRGYVVSAEDGRVLYRRDLINYDAFSYRVWADTTGDLRPADGPIEDFSPHPTGMPDGKIPDFVPPSLVTVESLNGPLDPWLAPGATDTRGNNVDAYTDHKDPDGFGSGDVRGTVTSAGVFDRVYDTAKDPLDSPEQSEAAVIQLFYMNNWLHDSWYDSGFDEAAGNAQKDNFGRGGVGGDRLVAQAQDGALSGSLDNANMATPEDGASPRMQMFLWSAPNLSSALTSVSPATLTTGAAGFGPTDFDLTADVGRADDGVGTTTDACQPLVVDLTGQIALVDRGTCTFHEKALNAEAAGAVGMLLINNQGGSPPDMPASNFGPVSIPVLSLTQTDGNAIAAALAGGTVTATLQRSSGVQVDGTIDNLVVAHEWGHYLHHRLVFCALNQCGGESEGWGDFLSLITRLRPGDDLNGTYADTLYASRAYTDHGYFGIRRMPYSVDQTKNAFTFKHISSSANLPTTVPMADSFADNAEVHNAGEIWTTMLFEAYVELLRKSEGPSPKYSFEEARRRMQDYIVLGMKLAPAEPTFTEQRDAILAAALASDAGDALLLAQGFATRGAGSCAVSPPKESFDNEGVVESFVVAPALAIGPVTLGDSVVSCDGDGRLDAGETGTVSFTVTNASVVEATDTTITLLTDTPGVELTAGNVLTIPTLAPLAVQTVTFPVSLSADVSDTFPISLTVRAENAAGCQPLVEASTAPRANYDDLPASSSTADFESDIEVWHTLGNLGDAIWQRGAQDSGPNHVYHGVDYGSISDTSLVSPPLLVSADQDLTLSFKHRHTFEESPGPSGAAEHWDGAVLEIRVDGQSFEDISSFGNPSYGGTIGNLASNPLSDRPGYVGQNNAWPAMETVTIPLGKTFAGQTIELRFRIGTDEAASEFGWELDDVSLTGLAELPFPSVVVDTSTCGGTPSGAPRAELGADRTVSSGEVVDLDASASADPDGDALSFVWEQVSGPGVELTTNNERATFVAPEVTSPTRMAVSVTASSLDGQDTDTVDVLVQPRLALAPTLSAEGGCGCRTAPQSDRPYTASLLGLAALAWGARRGRRKARNS